jgi:AcrR family transcriptional regulator
VGFSSVNTLVYGWEMNERLSKADWIRHGLGTLARDGAGALKAASLADALGVSRGSFYWHFGDIADYKRQLLQAWQESSTDRVIASLDARKGEPGLLKELMQGAFTGGRRLDRAVRAWAAVDRDAAGIVAAVDAKRVSRLAGLLAEAGVDRAHASHRAAFLYWAYLGQVAVMDRRYASLPAAALDDISDLLEK